MSESGLVDPAYTDRLDLEPLGLHHVDDLLALDSDPEVMRYINGGRASTPPEVDAVVRRSIGPRWVAAERASGGFIGWFALDRHRGDGLELGYRLMRAAWGRGLATEGSLALIAVAFSTLGATRVWAQTMAVNLRSRRVLERCGMRQVRTLHLVWEEPIDGAELGEVEYELVRQHWHGDGTH
jgi:RimJ/RimL family protein N-acetyltransferase